MGDAVVLHPDVAVLGALLGTWRGAGRGVYPTVADFAYDEEVRFDHIGKPFLTYAQRTVLTDGRGPSHAETGFVRCGGAGDVELVLAHPTGVTEIAQGTVTSTATGLRVEVASTAIGMTATAKPIESLHRLVELDGDTLRYTVDMAAVGEPLQRHLEAELHRA
jgi:hypothetical protein